MPACCGDEQGWKKWLTGVLGLGLGLAALFAVPATAFFGRTAQLDTADPMSQRWACPMMDFIGTRPGPCPVCGMALQKVTAGELTSEQIKRMGVQLVTIEAGPAIVTIHAYGAARYDDRTEQLVVARVAGRVVKRHGGALHPGLNVAVGDPLIDLYSPDIFAAQGELAAALTLGDQDLIASINKRFDRWNLSHVAQGISAGGHPMDTISIRSPYAGRAVFDKEMGNAGMVKNGADIMPGQPLVRLVDPVAYMVVVHVPEARARLIREGQPVTIASDDAGELPDVAASVSWVAPELNPEIRAREVHLHLRDPHLRLLPGSLINAHFQAVLGPDLQPADPRDATTWGRFPLVPASAVLSTGVRNIAWKVSAITSDGRQQFAIAPLALGQRLEDQHGNDLFVVRAGLVVGDQVATQGAFLIDSQAQLAGSASLLFPVGAAAPDPAHQH